MSWTGVPLHQWLIREFPLMAPFVVPALGYIFFAAKFNRGIDASMEQSSKYLMRQKMIEDYQVNHLHHLKEAHESGCDRCKLVKNGVPA